jgi:hypothetical protein
VSITPLLLAPASRPHASTNWAGNGTASKTLPPATDTELIAEINAELRELCARQHKERHDAEWIGRVETLIDEELLDGRHGERLFSLVQEAMMGK